MVDAAAHRRPVAWRHLAGNKMNPLLKLAGKLQAGKPDKYLVLDVCCLVVEVEHGNNCSMNKVFFKDKKKGSI